MSNLVIVTGASRGLGKAISITFAKTLSGTKHFILSARDSRALEATKTELLALSSPASTITVSTHVFDFAHVDTLAAAVASMLDVSGTGAATFNKVYLINNAGSLGPLNPMGANEFTLPECVATVNANITSCFYLTNEVVKKYKAKQFKSASELIVVNISSLAAIQPFLTFGLYGTGKAAREMFHKILAEEHKNGAEGISVLNYAPGPLDTDMMTEIQTGSGVDKDTQAYYAKMKESKTLVTCEQTSAKLLQILQSPQGFTSGTHIDFYDAFP